MKEVTFTSNWGRFNYAISAQVSDTLTGPELATVKQGLANCGFRAVGSGVEKALVTAKAMHKDDSRKVAESAEAALAAAAAVVLLSHRYGSRALGLPPSVVGLSAAAGRILGLYGLGSLAGSYLGGWLSDRILPRRVLLLSLTFGGIAFLWSVGVVRDRIGANG
jgi:hypothetical protein